MEIMLHILKQKAFTSLVLSWAVVIAEGMGPNACWNSDGMTPELRIF